MCVSNSLGKISWKIHVCEPNGLGKNILKILVCGPIVLEKILKKIQVPIVLRKIFLKKSTFVVLGSLWSIFGFEILFYKSMFVDIIFWEKNHYFHGKKSLKKSTFANCLRKHILNKIHVCLGKHSQINPCLWIVLEKKILKIQVYPGNKRSKFGEKCSLKIHDCPPKNSIKIHYCPAKNL